MPELRRISPFKCRMWDMHDRLGEAGTDRACRALIDSISAQGQKQPVLGRRLRDSSDYEVELIYGARRLHAVREIGIDLLVELRDMDDRAALIEMDIENRVREDITPYERGISYKRWLRAGLFETQAEVAKALGVSEAQISRLLKYADLPAALVGAFKTPADIREEWAGVLWKLSKEAAFREGLLRRARKLAAAGQALSPREVYGILIDDGTKRTVTSRSRDRIVKGKQGRPLFRIGFRAKSVHLILPRDELTTDVLETLSDQVRESLEACKGKGPAGHSMARD